MPSDPHHRTTGKRTSLAAEDCQPLLQMAPLTEVTLRGASIDDKVVDLVAPVRKGEPSAAIA